LTGDFLQSSKHGINYYGISLSEVIAIIQLGFVPVVNIDIDAAIQLESNFSDMNIKNNLSTPDTSISRIYFFTVSNVDLKYSVPIRTYVSNTVEYLSADTVEMQKIQANIALFYKNYSIKSTIADKKLNKLLV